MDGSETQTDRFEEAQARVADPDVVTQVLQEYSPNVWGYETSRDQFPEHEPLQTHVLNEEKISEAHCERERKKSL